MAYSSRRYLGPTPRAPTKLRGRGGGGGTRGNCNWHIILLDTSQEQIWLPCSFSPGNKLTCLYRSPDNVHVTCTDTQYSRSPAHFYVCSSLHLHRLVLGSLVHRMYDDDIEEAPEPLYPPPSPWQPSHRQRQNQESEVHPEVGSVRPSLQRDPSVVQSPLREILHSGEVRVGKMRHHLRLSCCCCMRDKIHFFLNLPEVWSCVLVRGRQCADCAVNRTWHAMRHSDNGAKFRELTNGM